VPLKSIWTTLVTLWKMGGVKKRALEKSTTSSKVRPEKLAAPENSASLKRAFANEML
jgi:hypothetical protein